MWIHGALLVELEPVNPLPPMNDADRQRTGRISELQNAGV